MSHNAFVRRGRVLISNTLAAFQIFRRFPILAPVAFIMLVNEMNFSGINNVAIPAYLQGLSLGMAAKASLIGFVASTFLFAETVCRIPCGWLSDRFGRARLITLAILLTGPSFLCTALITQYQWIFALRAWDGLMAAALFTSIYAIIGDTVPERYRANAMGVVNAMYMVGLMAGYALAGGIDSLTRQPRNFLFISASVAVLAGCIALYYFRTHRELNQQHPEVHLEDAEKATVSVTRHVVLLLVTFAQNLALTIIAPLMYLFAASQDASVLREGGLGLPLSALGLLVGAPLFGVALCAIPLSRLADKIGKLTAVRVAFIGVAATLWIFAATRELWLLSLAATIVGVAFSMGVPAWLAILSSLAGSKTRGATLGGYGTVQGIAAVIGPLIGTFVRMHYGLPKIFIASAILVGVAALLVIFALPEPGSPPGKAVRMRRKSLK